jgi:hypothetical protein
MPWAVFTRAAAVVLLSVGTLAAPAAQQAAPPPQGQPAEVAPAPAAPPHAEASPADALPVPAEFVRRVREAVKLDYELQKDYTYVEKRRDVKLSTFGKVSVGPMRTFEVYPSTEPGKTYKRLVAIDGKPLDRAELERRDAEHRQNMIAQVEREKLETPAQRALRVEKKTKERREREAIMNDAFAIYEPRMAGRETLDGQPVLVATLTPRKNVQPKTREGKWMVKFSGSIWVSESDYQIAKIEMTALDDLTIGLGIVGRVHEGSKLTFARRKVNNEVWLPAEASMKATGRTLLFRTFSFDTITTFSDYRKWSVDTSVTYGVPPKSLP